MDSPQDGALFGAWLRRRRKGLDLTQKALARRVGCSAATIRKLEADERKPSRGTAKALAAALGVSGEEHDAFIRFARAGWADVPPVGAQSDGDRPWLAHAAAPSPEAERTWSPVPQDSQLADAPSGEAAVSSHHDRDGPQPLPVVAREEQLGRLRDALEQTLAGRGHMMLIAGEPGQGKTTLMRAFAARAQELAPDLLVVMGGCNAYTGTGDPFQPFREALGELTGDLQTATGAGAFERERGRRLLRSLPAIWDAVLETAPALIGTLLPARRLLARLARAGAPAPPGWVAARAANSGAAEGGGGTHAALRAAVTDLITTVSANAPILVVLDDLQWVDDSSADVALHLARSVSAHRVLVVGAFRPSDVVGTDDHPLHVMNRVLREVERVHGAAVIDLDRADGRAFLEAWLDTDPNQLDSDFRETLWRQTGGQPLLTVELVRAMQERGELVKDAEGRWAPSGELRWETLPRRVAGVLGERIDRLDRLAQDVLRVASVEGEVFTLEAVARVLEQEPRGLTRIAGEELHRRKQLVLPLDTHRGVSGLVSRYRFRHNLIQRFVYDSIDEAERGYLHEAVGTALEVLLGEEADPVVLADHFVRARAPDRAVTYLRRAGDRARESGALDQAVKDYRAALQYWHDPEPREQAAVLLHMGYCEFARGHGDAAREVLQRARAESLESGDIEAACVALALIGRVLYEQQEYAAGLAACTEAVEILEPRAETPELARVLSQRSVLHMFLGDSSQALEDGERALDIANRLHTEDARVRALVSMGTLLPGVGPARREEGFAMLRESFRAAERVGMADEAFASLGNAGGQLLSLGRFEEARELLQRAIAYGRKRAMGPVVAVFVIGLWWLSWIQGRWAEALEQVPHLRAFLGGRTALTRTLVNIPVYLASADLDLGRPEAAAAILDEHQVSLQRSEEEGDRENYLRERLRIAAMQGRVAEADVQADALLETLNSRSAHRFGAVLPALTACHWLAGRRSASAERGLRTCLAILETTDQRYGAPLARSALLEAQAVAANALDDAGEAADLAREAAEGWRSAGMPRDEARARITAAHALRWAGRDRDVNLELAAAGVLWDSLAAELPEGEIRTDFRRVQRAMLEDRGFVL